jgi:hypothetical protein
MKKFLPLAAVIGCIVILVAVFYLFEKPVSVVTSPKEYTSPALGISFEYPALYFIIEMEQGGANNTHAIILAEDTEENRDVFAGKSPGREGPPTIGVYVYALPSGETLESWIRNTNESNFSISHEKVLIPTTVAGLSALSYTWSGLYEGHTVGVVSGGKIFLFTENYLTQEDRIRADFVGVLKSVKFSGN